MIKNVVKVLCFLQMEINMKATGSMINFQERVFLNTKMVIFMRANGYLARKLVKHW